MAERFSSTVPNRGAPIVPQLFWGTPSGNKFSKSLTTTALWWTHKGSNLGPLPCEGNALPLSYASGIFVHDRRPVDQHPIRVNHAVRAAIYEVQGTGVKLTGVKLSRQTERDVRVRSAAAGGRGK